MKIEVFFPGNRKVDAKVGNFVVHTDQPTIAGGDDSAPAPFSLFLASLATCAGIFVKEFCLQRDIPTDNIRIIQESIRGEQKGLLKQINLEIQVPSDFPEQYKKALINVASLCTVKKNIQSPPEFDISVKTI